MNSVRLRNARKKSTCIDCGTATYGTRCRPCNCKKMNVPGRPVTRTKREYLCQHCGTTFTRRLRGRDLPTYCSFDCYLIASDAKPSSPVAFGQCSWCGIWFRKNPRRSYCTSKCRLDASLGNGAERITNLYRLTTKLGIAGQNWRYNLKQALRERDGDLCCLCWTPIDFTVKSGPQGSDNGYSFEHIRPWSLSHDDTWGNLALSHWGCNRNRRTNPIDTLIRS